MPEKEQTLSLRGNATKLSLTPDEWDILLSLLEAHRGVMQSFIREQSSRDDTVLQDLEITTRLIHKLHDLSCELRSEATSL
jgi:hypothetical protein